MTPKHSVVVTVWSGVVPESGRASIFILICNSNSNSARVSKDRKRRKRKVESTKCSDWSIEAITLRVLQLSMIRNAEWIYKKNRKKWKPWFWSVAVGVGGGGDWVAMLATLLLRCKGPKDSWEWAFIRSSASPTFSYATRQFTHKKPPT